MSDLLDYEKALAQKQAEKNKKRRKRKQNKTAAESTLCTDYGNGQLMVQQYGHIWRYSAQMGKDFIYDGKRWKPDETLTVERMAQEIPKLLLSKASEAPTQREQAELAEWAITSQSAPRIAAMIKLARPHVAISVDTLDADPWLFNVQNGTIDLRTGKLIPHDPKHLITKLAPVTYDLSAKAILWDKFLNDIFAGDKDLIAFVQRYAGYSMIGEVVEHALAILHGAGSNGKSVLLDILLYVFGDYGCVTDPDLLLAKNNESHPTNIAALKGVRLAVTSETEEGRRLAESTVKSLTGADKRTARFMRQDFFEYVPSDTFWMATNHRPQIRGRDLGIWRRIKMIPFKVTFVEDELDVLPPLKLPKDKKLPKKLKQEVSGILNWLIAGCMAWQQEGLNDPPEVIEATNEYKNESDPLTDFVADMCIMDRRAEVGSTALYNVYRSWTEENGYRAMSQRRFTESMKQKYPDISVEHTRNGKVWHGIGVTDVMHVTDYPGSPKMYIENAYNQGKGSHPSQASQTPGDDGEVIA
ncbi:phage/plasmid primase, P4 family [Alicyclobacillus tolerans]|uniref:DNA primase family protein n=1 Tax=Alicyclobacillus tolerans TaxID=90970 RepID=UPI001F025B00|nr:DNA primase family protein [Alicyclobacillus tolerans]MCF8567729.1 phage/plasmid primase, P4 family [Alicyclobacillus tolerans]